MDAQKKSFVFAERLTEQHQARRFEFEQEVARVPRDKRVYVDQCGLGQHLELCLGVEPQRNTLSRREAGPQDAEGVGDGGAVSGATSGSADFYRFL